MQLRGRELSLAGIRETYVNDGGDVVENLVATSHLDRLIELNRKAQNNDNPKAMLDGSDGMRLVARIPAWLVEKIANDHGVNLLSKENEEYMWRLLRDPDYRWLKTTEEAL